MLFAEQLRALQMARITSASKGSRGNHYAAVKSEEKKSTWRTKGADPMMTKFRG